MAFTTYISIEKPDYQLLRFDIPVNENWDLLDDALRCWASANEPGHADNYDDITLTEGILWRDTGNHLLQIRGAAAWEYVFSSTTRYNIDITNPTDTTTYDPTINFKTGATPTLRAKIYVDDSNNDDMIFDLDTASSVVRFQVNNAADSVVINATGVIDLAGQTITTVNASGTADLTDWCDQIGADDADDCKFALQIKVAGTTYYVPAFTAV